MSFLFLMKSRLRAEVTISGDQYHFFSLLGSSQLCKVIKRGGLISFCLFKF
jgi:hypothetical protein